MKTYMIIKTNRRTDSETVFTGSLKELIPMFSYTLETGVSYQHEKSNKKINTQPKTIKSLVNNLNNAVNNAAANGYSNYFYTYSEI